MLAFSRLKSFSFLNRYADRYQVLEEDDPQLDSMKQTITTTSPSLRSLGIFGDVLWKCNIQRLSTLVELTIVLLTQANNIGSVFIHCSHLRSLTLLAGDKHYAELDTIFHTHFAALPLLTAFRISCPSMTEGDAAAVATFLRRKPLLERLEIGHHWEPSSFDDLAPLLNVLSELPHLRVLGFELSGSRDSSELTPDHLLRLSECIPPGLTALSLWVVTSTPSTVTETDWIQLVRPLSCSIVFLCAS